MKRSRISLLGLIVLTILPAIAIAQSPSVPATDPQRMDWFNDARFGMFIHWGVYSVPAGEYGDGKNHAEWIQLTAKIPNAEYEKYAAQFNPIKFDAKSWVMVAKDAGMKYIVITAKHHDGFCMFGTKLTDYNIVKATPFGRDPLKELSEACREAGIKFCVYYSVPDWHHPDFPEKYGQRGGFHGAPNPDADLDKYVEFVKGQVRELLTNYGPIGILWFDGGGSFSKERPQMPQLMHSQEIIDEIRQLQPQCLVNNRLGLPGDYTTPEQKIPPSGLGMPSETCMTLNKHWGYNKFDNNWKEASVVVQNLADIASKGGNYLLNVGPTAEGVFPPDAVRILADVGNWMRVNGESIYGTSACPFDTAPEWGRITKKGSKLYLHVFNPPANSRISLPGKVSGAKRAYLLADSDKRPLELNRGEQVISVNLLAENRDRIETVVVLETD
jgi:alpha-L-fucosidase